VTDVELIVMGTSQGGLAAVQTLLQGLPEGFNVPLAIVQHRGHDREERLISLLQRKTSLHVTEPNDKEEIRPGYVYLAPTDYHLLVDAGCFHLSLEERVCYARPSIDVLFESAATAYGERLVGVMLTGANTDGAEGAKRIREHGGTLIVQDPRTAEAGTMPAAVQHIANQVLPLEEIAAYLGKSCTRRNM
jgi:two-component system chemotaxis response regulator CheB